MRSGEDYTKTHMFELAEAYERQRGRSSKLLAPLFADFVGVRGEVLDVGCGTGALTFTIAKNTAVSKVVGLDLSDGFLAYARSKTDDKRILFEHGDAQKLPFPNHAFDCCLALLVVGFLPDAPSAAREMRRVTRRAVSSLPHGGTTASRTRLINPSGRRQLCSIRRTPRSVAA